MNWIKETKEVVRKHKKRCEPMTYVIPTENDCSCFICGRYIPKKVKKLHDMDEAGEVRVYCGDECYMRSGTYTIIL